MQYFIAHTFLFNINNPAFLWLKNTAKTPKFVTSKFTLEHIS